MIRFAALLVMASHFALPAHAQAPPAEPIPSCTDYPVITIETLQEVIAAAAQRPAERADLRCHDLGHILNDAGRPDLFKGQSIENLDLRGARFIELDLTDSSFARVGLAGADFGGSTLIGADLNGADLNSADLTAADLEGADLIRTNLSGSTLLGTNLKQAVLTGSDLAGASLRNVDVTGADLVRVNLAETLWETTGKLDSGKLAGMTGLRQIRIRLCPDSPRPDRLRDCANLAGNPDFGGLNQLIAGLKEAGHRQLELDAVAARETMKTNLALARWWQHGTDAFDQGVAGLLRFVVYEWTVDYGREPFGAFVIMFWLFVGFGIVYVLALYFVPFADSFGFYRVLQANRIQCTDEYNDRYELARDAEVKRIRRTAFPRALVIGFYYSILMTFRIGFRDVNVGEWLLRLRGEDITYVSRGWLRTAAGVQSLVSLVLLGVFLITFFGRPFQ